MSILECTRSDVVSWKTRELWDYVGGLSKPSKMPGWAYGLPAAECGVGTRLRDVRGSTCEFCYAYERGMYKFPVVKAAQYRRLESITRPLWSECMSELITRKNVPWFRWHDSGDLQSLEHLAAIVDVCELTPDVRHWLPTRENRIVGEYVKAYGGFPANLCVRLSAHMVGGQVGKHARLAGLVTVSTVSTEGMAGAHECPARFQDNSCGDCRACWSMDVQHVDYHLH